MRFLSAVLSAVLAGAAFAQAPYLVTDLNAARVQAKNSSFPGSFKEMNGSVLFSATTADMGRELWRIADGSISLLRDVNPGPGSFSPGTLMNLSPGVALFSAFDEEHQRELWRTDGTAEGTFLVKDLHPTGSSNVAMRTAGGGKVFFQADDGVHGVEPWVSDGTAEGTRMLADLDAEEISIMRWAEDRLYIFTPDSLWVSDGTAEGTRRVDATFLGPQRSVAVGSTVYFTAATHASGRELWVTDGTDAGTRMVLELAPGAFPAFPYSAPAVTAHGSLIYFAATDDGTNVDLWKTDGTATGTQLVRAAITVTGSTMPTIQSANGLLWIETYEGLWRSDGTAAGTFLIATGERDRVGMYPAFGTVLFFRMRGDGTQLWSTDGSVAGTTHIVTLPASWPLSAEFVGGKLYFSLDDGISGDELWVCEDGTAAGTHRLANLNSDPVPSGFPESLTVLGNEVYFAGEDDASAARQIFRTDGVTTTRVTQFDTNESLANLTASGGALWFTRDVYRRLWRSDAVETRLIYEAGITSLFAATNGFYFNTHDTAWSAGGNEPVALPVERPRGWAEQAGRVYVAGVPDTLYTTAGTPETTTRLAPLSSALISLVPAAGALFFSDTMLRRTDGTIEGTTVVRPFPAASLTAAGPYLYFLASGALWRTDGTEGGTLLLKQIAASLLTEAGGLLYFRGEDDAGAELWRSDGSVEGTMRVSDIRPGSASSNPQHLAAVQGALYFAADDGTHGVELWRTNAAGGVELVADLEPGAASSSPQWMTFAGSKLYFAATTSMTGRELWALPLGNTTISISDVRVTEGHSGATIARFTVTRGGDTQSAASVAFTTANASAIAGEDYVAQSGIVSFAAGESTRSVDVAVNGDRAIETHEAFFVILSSPNGAAIARAVATAFVDDDDRRAELTIEWLPSTVGNVATHRRFRVTNGGPSAATDVLLRYSESPYEAAFSVPGISCRATGCSLGALAAGASKEVVVHKSVPSPHYVDPARPPGQTIYAEVRAQENDADASDNAVSKMLSYDGQLVLPPYLVTGSSVRADLVLNLSTSGQRVVTLQTSSANVTATPSSITFTNAAREAAFTLTTGEATGAVRLDAGTASLMVPVVVAGTTPKLDVALQAIGAIVNYGETAEMTVRVAARLPDGTLPTGSITLLDTDGNVVLQQSLVNGATTFVRTGLRPGTHLWFARYDGDAHFNGLAGAEVRAEVRGLMTALSVSAPLVICGAADVSIVVRNIFEEAAPEGSITVRINAVDVATLPLQPSSVPGESFAVYRHEFPVGETYLHAIYDGSGAFESSSGDMRVTRRACLPLGVTATAVSSSVVNILWTPNGAHHYRVMWLQGDRWVSIGSTPGGSWSHAWLSANTTYVYTVFAENADDSVIGYAIPDFATTRTYTNDPLTPGLPVRLQHFAELRSAIWALRPSWITLTPIASGAPIRASHVLELRDALARVRHSLGMPPLSFSAAPAPGTPIRALHLQELRDALK